MSTALFQRGRAADASARTPGRWRLALAALLLLLPLSQLLVFVPLWWNVTDFGDAPAYHQAVQNIRAGLSMYDPLPPPGPHAMGHHYIYPPFFAALLALLPAVDVVTLERGIFAANIAGFWIYAACLGILARGRLELLPTLVAATAILLLPGGVWAIMYRNINPVVWALVGLALAAPAARGASFATAAMLKVFTVWPLAFAALRERRAVLTGALAALLAGAAICVAAVGVTGFVEACTTWLRHVMPTLGQGQFEVGAGPSPFIAWVLHGNWSLSFAPLMLAHVLGWEHAGPLPPLLAGWLTLAGVAAPVLTGLATRRAAPAMQYALVTCAALIFAPMFRPSYMPILLAPAALWLGDRRTRSSAAHVLP